MLGVVDGAMFEIEKFEFGGRSFMGLKSEIPGGPPLLLVRGEKGLVMCGYLNLEVAEKLGLAAAIVSGVSSFEDVFGAEVKAATSAARALGVEQGRVVRDVIHLLG